MDIQNKNEWTVKFLEACRGGNLEDVRHLCQKQYLDLEWADIHSNHEEGFYGACLNGHLNIIKYLLTSKDLIEAGHSFADLHANDEDGFRGACAYGHLEVVKYLLTSPDLIEAGHTFADLHALNEYGFCFACAYGHLDIVKYLLTSPDLIEAGHSFTDAHAVDDEGFRGACEYEHWNVVRWLVLDYGIEKTPAMNEMVQEYPQAQEYLQVREELKEIQGVIRSHEEDQVMDSNERLDGRTVKKMKKL